MANWKKIALFKKFLNFYSVFQNSLAFLGQIVKASLSEFPKIYGWVIGENLLELETREQVKFVFNLDANGNLQFCFGRILKIGYVSFYCRLKNSRFFVPAIVKCFDRNIITLFLLYEQN